MQLFYCKEIAQGGFCTLDAEESRHAVRVMRMHEGDAIHLTDGCGHLYGCRIVVADERACVVAVEHLVAAEGGEEQEQTPRPKLHLAVAPTKNPSRMEWMVEKAVEVGVEEITLLQCEHSERTFLKTDRLERVALSAMKQSLHTVLPRIVGTLPFAEWVAQWAQPCQPGVCQLIAHCDADSERTPLASALMPGRDVAMLIGPEGDFSPTEIESALRAGFAPVSLGTHRLRTETAALYAAMAFNFANDR